MNISPVNSSKASFGKINWGSKDRTNKTEKALRDLKLANDFEGHNKVKYTDVVEQLKILAEHKDTFLVSAYMVNRPEERSTFVLDVREGDCKTPIDTFRASYLSNEDNTTPYTNERFHRTILSTFAKNVLRLHDENIAKIEVSSLMSSLGETSINE